ncbi:MAG: hypothetical protein ACJ04Q_01330 [Flavobacteriales bacterium]
MKKTHVLHDLIHSLSKSEKRFIRLNAQFHQGDKTYMKLFDAIERQKNYDEEVLKVKFRNEKFINQFGVAKNYLQQFILKQLRQYHAGLKVNIECKNLLIDIEILFWKGQYNLAKKIILKTTKIAQRYDFFLVLEELNYWEGRIHNALFKLNETYKTALEDSSKQNIQKYLNILQYRELINTAQLMMKESELVRGEDEKDRYNAFLKNPLLTDISLAQSNEAKYNYYVLNGVLYRVIGCMEKSEAFRKQLVNFLEANPHLIEENPIHYIAALHNVLTHFLVKHDYPEFNKYLEKLKTFNFKMPHEKASVFSSLCLFELGYYMERKDYEKAITFIENTITKYEDINTLINIQHSFLLNYHAALIYFNVGNYKNALLWINKVINITSRNLRVDVKAAAFLLNILIHHELKNLLLIPYLVKSTIEFLKQHHLQTEFDKKCLLVLLALSKTNDEKQQQKIIAKNLPALEKLDKNTSTVSDIDVIEWLKHKMI